MKIDEGSHPRRSQPYDENSDDFKCSNDRKPYCAYIGFGGLVFFDKFSCWPTSLKREGETRNDSPFTSRRGTSHSVHLGARGTPVVFQHLFKGLRDHDSQRFCQRGQRLC